MNMKRILPLLLSLAMALALCACGSQSSSDGAQTSVSGIRTHVFSQCTRNQ